MTERRKSQIHVGMLAVTLNHWAGSWSLWAPRLESDCGHLVGYIYLHIAVVFFQKK